jgi:hypothetical protein
MGAKFSAAFAAFAFTVLSFLLFASPASAAGSFKLKTAQVTESGGQWHLFVTLELPRAPATAHVPMKFLFTKEMVFERALIDGHDQPVLNRTALTNQMPSVESVDVDFADGSGKVFKGTRFDFSLSRDHGYEAGQYRPSTQSQEVAPSGSAAPFIPPDAYNKTPEEEVKTRPAGCCGVAGSHGDYGTGAMAAFAFGAAVMFARRRRRG